MMESLLSVAGFDKPILVYRENSQNWHVNYSNLDHSAKLKAGKQERADYTSLLEAFSLLDEVEVIETTPVVVKSGRTAASKMADQTEELSTALMVSSQDSSMNISSRDRARNLTSEAEPINWSEGRHERIIGEDSKLGDRIDVIALDPYKTPFRGLLSS